MEEHDVKRKGGVCSEWIKQIVEDSTKAMQEFFEELNREGVYDMPSGPERVIKTMKIYQKYWKRFLPLHMLLMAMLTRKDD